MIHKYLSLFLILSLNLLLAGNTTYKSNESFSISANDSLPGDLIAYGGRCIFSRLTHYNRTGEYCLKLRGNSLAYHADGAPTATSSSQIVRDANTAPFFI